MSKTVLLDEEAIRTILAQCGVTLYEFSRMCGKCDTYINRVFTNNNARGVRAETASFIEDEINKLAGTTQRLSIVKNWFNNNSEVEGNKMIGNIDFVVPNAEELNKDLKKFGLSASALNRKLGKGSTYLNDVFTQKKAYRKTIESVEDCMFREHGAYYTELEEVKDPHISDERPRNNIAKEIVDELYESDKLWSTIDETISSSYCRTRSLFEGLESAIRETQAENRKLLEAILQKEKEICTLNAKLLATWEVKHK